MAPNNSPLRYPGGKSRVTNYVAKLIFDNNIIDGNYVEAFAGGCGVALNLLIRNKVKNIYINDMDKSIYAFWYIVLNHTDKFINKIENIDVTIDEWRKQKEIQEKKNEADIFDLGFSTFFLNRANRSGIIMAGAIGGIKQEGTWKIDARFNKKTLIEKIKKIAQYKKNIHLSNKDAVAFLQKDISKLDLDNTLIYLDPPYYVKGGQLYMNAFKHDDHVRVYNTVDKLKHKWIVSYDDQPEIKEIYKEENKISYFLRYTAGTKTQGSELMFFSKGLKYDPDISPLDVKR